MSCQGLVLICLVLVRKKREPEIDNCGRSEKIKKIFYVLNLALLMAEVINCLKDLK